MTWEEYQVWAGGAIAAAYPGAVGKVTFMKIHGYDPDGEMYDFPDYVEIELKEDGDGKTKE